MSISRRKLIKALGLTLPAMRFMPGLAMGNVGMRGMPVPPVMGGVPPDIFPGPFTGTRESLKNYVIPEWFRDVKFGIWAHWGPQSAIGAGDWYARNMYMQGERQYAYHLEHYGHPSKFGYKDTIPAWRAEAFDADHLIGLYKKAGAQYFMSMGAHHDNFDLWNSKYNDWNSVKMGPKIDIVGLWRQAAKKHGLKFGISDHLWISPKWFSVSKGSDATGALAGVPYDGANPEFASLYGDSTAIFKKLPWNEEGISEDWKKLWFKRIKDLVDNYEPDLLYCDGPIPFEEYGLSILANLYNRSAAKHDGKTQAIYTSKRPQDSEVGTCVFDVERGVVDTIWPRPWQTDTCIGDWHYNKARVGHYKSAKTVIDLLVDIVSRNGNLMLNIPLPASGMPDNDELAVIDGITKWMAVNSDGIYSTRPWKIFGVGPQSAVTTKAGEVNSAQTFNERNRKDLSFEDIRFTTKKNTLYAFFMGWPDGKQVVIRPLATGSEQKTGEIEAVELLGHGKVEFSRDGEGLKVSLPERAPCDLAYTLRISGHNLV